MESTQEQRARKREKRRKEEAAQNQEQGLTDSDEEAAQDEPANRLEALGIKIYEEAMLKLQAHVEAFNVANHKVPTPEEIIEHGVKANGMIFNRPNLSEEERQEFEALNQNFFGAPSGSTLTIDPASLQNTMNQIVDRFNDYYTNQRDPSQLDPIRVLVAEFNAQLRGVHPQVYHLPEMKPNMADPTIIGVLAAEVALDKMLKSITPENIIAAYDDPVLRKFYDYMAEVFLDREQEEENNMEEYTDSPFIGANTQRVKKAAAKKNQPAGGGVGKGGRPTSNSNKVDKSRQAKTKNSLKRKIINPTDDDLKRRAFAAEPVDDEDVDGIQSLSDQAEESIETVGEVAAMTAEVVEAPPPVVNIDNLQEKEAELEGKAKAILAKANNSFYHTFTSRYVDIVHDLVVAPARASVAAYGSLLAAVQATEQEMAAEAAERQRLEQVERELNSQENWAQRKFRSSKAFVAKGAKFMMDTMKGLFALIRNADAAKGWELLRHTFSYFISQFVSVLHTFGHGVISLAPGALLAKSLSPGASEEMMKRELKRRKEALEELVRKGKVSSVAAETEKLRSLRVATEQAVKDCEQELSTIIANDKIPHIPGSDNMVDVPTVDGMLAHRIKAKLVMERILDMHEVQARRMMHRYPTRPHKEINDELAKDTAKMIIDVYKISKSEPPPSGATGEARVAEINHYRETKLNEYVESPEVAGQWGDLCKFIHLQGGHGHAEAFYTKRQMQERITRNCAMNVRGAVEGTIEGLAAPCFQPDPKPDVKLPPAFQERRQQKLAAINQILIRHDANYTAHDTTNRTIHDILIRNGIPHDTAVRVTQYATTNNATRVAFANLIDAELLHRASNSDRNVLNSCSAQLRHEAAITMEEYGSIGKQRVEAQAALDKANQYNSSIVRGLAFLTASIVFNTAMGNAIGTMSNAASVVNLLYTAGMASSKRTEAFYMKELSDYQVMFGRDYSKLSQDEQAFMKDLANNAEFYQNANANAQKIYYVVGSAMVLYNAKSWWSNSPDTTMSLPDQTDLAKETWANWMLRMGGDAVGYVRYCYQRLVVGTVDWYWKQLVAVPTSISSALLTALGVQVELDKEAGMISANAMTWLGMAAGGIGAVYVTSLITQTVMNYLYVGDWKSSFKYAITGVSDSDRLVQEMMSIKKQIEEIQHPENIGSHYNNTLKTMWYEFTHSYPIRLMLHTKDMIGNSFLVSPFMRNVWLDWNQSMAEKTKDTSFLSTVDTLRDLVNVPLIDAEDISRDSLAQRAWNSMYDKVEKQNQPPGYLEWFKWFWTRPKKEVLDEALKEIQRTNEAEEQFMQCQSDINLYTHVRAQQNRRQQHNDEVRAEQEKATQIDLQSRTARGQPNAANPLLGYEDPLGRETDSTLTTMREGATRAIIGALCTEINPDVEVNRVLPLYHGSSQICDEFMNNINNHHQGQ